MADLNKAELRAALAAGREARRKRSPNPSGSGLAHARRLAAQQGSPERTPLPAVAAAGHDVRELRELHAQAQSNARHLLTKQRSSSMRRSASSRETLRSDAEGHRKMVEHLASRKPDALPPGLNFNFVILDTPALVLPTQDIVLNAPHLEPWNNTAKFSAEWDTDTFPGSQFADSVSFVFAWENPHPSATIVNVESALMFNGFCETYASGGWYVINNADLDVYAELDVYEWWNNPPTSPPFQAAQRQHVLRLRSRSEGEFYAWGDPEWASVSGYYDLRYQQFVLPPRGVAVFEVAVSIEHSFPHLGPSADSGSVRVDFESEGFEVMCPAVVLAILG
jgi:hypothetical protein